MQAANDIPATARVLVGLAAETSQTTLGASGPALSTVLWIVAVVTSCVMVLVMLGFMLCVVIRLYRLEELLGRAKLGARILAHRASEQTTEAISAAKNVAARITSSSSSNDASKQYHRRTAGEPQHPSYYVEEEPQVVYDFAGEVEPSDTDPLPVHYVSDIEAPPPPPANTPMQHHQRTTLHESAKAMEQLMPVAEPPPSRPVYQRGANDTGSGGLSRRNGHINSQRQQQQRSQNLPRHRYPPQPRGVRGIKVGPGYGSRPRSGGSMFVATSLRSKSAPPPTQKLSGGDSSAPPAASRSSFEEISLSSTAAAAGGKNEPEAKDLSRRDL